MRRILTAAVLVAAIAVTTGCAQEPPPIKESVQRYYDENVANKKATLAPTVAPTVAVIGDSYTAPAGVKPTDNYVGLLASRMGWKAASFGQGGTGYTNAGDQSQGKGVYLARVPKVIAAKPDVVIVQGSTNDHGPAVDTQAAAEAVYAALRKGLPKAKIVVVGPLSPPDAVPAEVAQTRAGLIAATKNAGVKFIDPTAEKWLQPTTGLFVDGFHPNLTGHRKISEELAADLAALNVG